MLLFHKDSLYVLPQIPGFNKTVLFSAFFLITVHCAAVPPTLY